MSQSTPTPKSNVASSTDEFFPSSRFAKVPAEALGSLAWKGPHRMEHSEFRLFVALARFRGVAQLVNPSQETLAAMTGMSRNNVSRAAHGLECKGWAVLHHQDGDPHKRIENYELKIPVPGKSPGVPPKPRKAGPRARKSVNTQVAEGVDAALPIEPAMHVGDVNCADQGDQADQADFADCAEYDERDSGFAYGADLGADSDPVAILELERQMAIFDALEAQASLGQWGESPLRTLNSR